MDNEREDSRSDCEGCSKAEGGNGESEASIFAEKLDKVIERMKGLKERIKSVLES
jgi:hypothetical protein